jgi:hypothetical protein
MHFRAFALILTFSAAVVSLAQPPRDGDPPTKDLSTKIELVYSGKQLDKFRDRFKEMKFESVELANVMSPKTNKYETVILDIACSSDGYHVVSMKISATTVEEFPPKAKLISSLTEKNKSFPEFVTILKDDIQKAVKIKKEEK